MIHGNDTRYTEWSADVKFSLLSYNSQITTTLGMSPYEMVFNQKPQNQLYSQQTLLKMHKVIVNQTKNQNVIIYLYNKHDEDHFHHPQILNLASGALTEWILNRDKKYYEIYQKATKKLLQRQNISNQINSRFTPATYLKIGTFVLIPNFTTQKGISEKLQTLRKGPYQIIDKPIEVTYKFSDSSKKEIVQHHTTYYLIIQKNTHFTN